MYNNTHIHDCDGRENLLVISRAKLGSHNQLTIPASPGPGSQTSTPAELDPEEVVSQLNDQVCVGMAMVCTLHSSMEPLNTLRLQMFASAFFF